MTIATGHFNNLKKRSENTDIEQKQNENEEFIAVLGASERRVIVAYPFIILIFMAMSSLLILRFSSFTLRAPVSLKISENNDVLIQSGLRIHRAYLYSYNNYFNVDKKLKPKLITPLSHSELYNPKVVCYYTIPPPGAGLRPSNIDLDLCTHINVAFTSINNETIAMSKSFINIVNEVVALKKDRNIKVLISIGGAGQDSGFPDMIATHATRKVFIKSLKTILKKYRLDGVDLDWEFPAVGSKKSPHLTKRDRRQRQHFSQLLREIRMEYQREKRGYLLTVAVAAPQTIVDISYDVREINQYADYINLMTYDMHSFTHYTPLTGLNSPLYKRDAEKLFLATLNINYTAHMWMDKGMEKKKIVIGIPTYGHTFTLVNEMNTEIGAPAQGFGSLGSQGFIDYPDVCAFLKSRQGRVNVIMDEKACSPYAFFGTEWVSFDNKESVVKKAKFIREYQFGGAMIFALNSDDYEGKCLIPDKVSFPLTRHVNEVLFSKE